MNTGSDASRTSVVLEPDASQLSLLRTTVSAWMTPEWQEAGLVEDVVLVASEMVAVGIERCDGEHPIVVDLRRTHSILVVEMTCHLSEKASVEDLGIGDERSPRLDLGLLEHLADRVTADVGRRVVTVSGTFHLGRLSSG